MDAKYQRRAAQVREAAKWVTDNAVRRQMLEAALYFDHLAMVDGNGPPEQTSGTNGAQGEAVV